MLLFLLVVAIIVFVVVIVVSVVGVAIKVWLTFGQEQLIYC